MAVDAYIAGLDAPTAAVVTRLRTLAMTAAEGVTEHVKWNAPSFCVAGDDRITLGLERAGGVRMVLHRGAKVKDSAGFVFADPAGLARWPAVDRGVVTIRDAAALEAMAPALADVMARWLAATA
ncbi:DUF1801 domain-containing protein [Sandarakinorhabdus sp. DWP1-3-1]|uniref:DUF1801 domain-containing protein n=1 Tax=Sandarakinorhabdus sp. DWP1-3-1 TaxID=2804627 RepID=UPI003CFA4BA5